MKEREDSWEDQMNERLVLQRIEPLPPLGDTLDVLPHDILRLVDLLLDRCRLTVPERNPVPNKQMHTNNDDPPERA
jgi:hypothetical protein